MGMKRDKTCAHHFLILLLVIVTIVYSTPAVAARVNPHRPNGGHRESTIFDITSFGAKGNGVSDDSKAFLAAWKAACKVVGATLLIPSDFKFLVRTTQLKGPCMPYLTLQIDGTLLAPRKGSSWKKAAWEWIRIKKIQNFTIQGTGIIDGQGFDWWKSKTTPKIKPAALRFDYCNNVTVLNIKVMNSPKFHMKFDNSRMVKVSNVTIASPFNSPNTDGIHIQDTQDVLIEQSNIGCGDDCISIQTGSSNVAIRNIYCGPGHGISIGGLGKDKSSACVSNILVDNVVMQNATNGARIKTWQGGRGSVQNVIFSNFQVSDVKNPIKINQYYCDKEKCHNQTDTVAITNVQFNQISGTYTKRPFYIACSDSFPCTNVNLMSIQLQPSTHSKKVKDGLCYQSYGYAQEPLSPRSLQSCLLDGRPDQASSPHKICES